MVKIILFLLFFTGNLFAAFESYQTDPNCIARGGVSSFNAPSRYCFLMFRLDPVVRLSYALPFGIAEFSREFVGLNFSALGNRKFYICADNFGNNTYRENSFTIAHALLDENIFQFTPSLSCYLLQTAEKNYNSISLNMASFFKLSDSFEIITTINNLYSLKLTEDEKIPIFYCLDLRYKISKNIYLYSGLEKDSKYEAIVKAGVEYRPLNFLKLMGGYNFEPELYSGGFEMQIGPFSFGYSFSYHTILDFSHAAGIAYEL